jgi:TetR/AcrR family transcriptional regulator
MKQLPDALAQRLLDHASDLLIGESELTINRAAEVTGIPRATLYYYFSGIDHLLSFFVDHITQYVHDATSKASQGSGSAPERLHSAVTAGMQIGRDEALLSAALVKGLSVSSLVVNLRNLYDHGYAPVRDILLEGLESGEFEFEDVDAVLQIIFGATVTYAMMQLDANGNVPVEGVDTLTRAILAGLQSATNVRPQKTRNGKVRSSSLPRR